MEYGIKKRRPGRVSAGVLLYRRRAEIEVLLVHPGGPFWRYRDVGAWMIPKGEVEPGEDPAKAAVREFEEELGSSPPGIPKHLCSIRQSGGKRVEVFVLEGDFDAETLVSIHFSIEYPPKSGRAATFPEVDAASWFSLDEARVKMLPSQLPILDALLTLLGAA